MLMPHMASSGLAVGKATWWEAWTEVAEVWLVAKQAAILFIWAISSVCAHDFRHLFVM